MKKAIRIILSQIVVMFGILVSGMMMGIVGWEMILCAIYHWLIGDSWEMGNELEMVGWILYIPVGMVHQWIVNPSNTLGPNW